MHISQAPSVGLLLPIYVISCACFKTVRRAGDIVNTIMRPLKPAAAAATPIFLFKKKKKPPREFEGKASLEKKLIASFQAISLESTSYPQNRVPPVHSVNVCMLTVY